MRVLFVNAGILGMQTFSKFIHDAMTSDPDIEARHINLTEDLRLSERVVRRVVCARVWPDGWLGLHNVDFARFRREFHAGLQASRRIRAAAADGAIDVIHFHRQTTAYASVPLMRQVPSIVSIDSTQDIVIDGASPIDRWTYQANVRRDGDVFAAARAIVSTSQWAADCLRRRYPDCRAPVHVMPSPVRLQFFPGDLADERFARATPDYVPRVLFIGGDFDRKGGFDLLAAWRDAGLSRVAALDIVTDSPQAASALPRVRVLHGIQSYSPAWLDIWRAADIFVMPTRSEAFANAFLEAAAAGLPRIGTAINAVPETIVDGQTGILVPPGDRASLAKALTQLIGAAEWRRDLGRGARAYATRCLSSEVYRSKLRDVIFSVSARSRAPRTFA
jgi:alpha-maltose-1-phosphate synthase